MSGHFQIFRKGELVEDYFMRKNFINGFHYKYINKLLYKKTNYEDGEIIHCSINLKTILVIEKNLVSWKKQLFDDNKNEDLRKKIINTIELLTIDKQNCKINEFN